MQNNQKNPIEVLGQIGREKQRILEVLRAIAVPMTYDRIAADMGYSINQYRSVSSMITDLRESHIICSAGKYITITGTRADGYIIQTPYDAAIFPWQNALFALNDYHASAKERVIRLVRNIGTKNADPHEVAESITDIIIGMTMPNDMVFEIDDIKTRALYIKGSETSEEAAERAKYFSSASRVRAYTAIIQGNRAKGRGVTRNEAIAISGMWPSSLLPRVHELLSGGYLVEGEEIKNPSTGKIHRTLLSTGKAKLTTTVVSDFYNDRLQIMEWIYSLLSVSTINGRYLAEPERIYSSAETWAKDFIKKHARLIEERDIELAEEAPEEPEEIEK